MMCVMHDAEPYGHLVAAGQPILPEELAAIIGGNPKDVRKWQEELKRRQVYSVTPEGVIHSRRMMRDEKERKEWRKRQARHRGPDGDVTRDVTEHVTRSVTEHVTAESLRTSSSSSSSSSFPLAKANGGDAAGEVLADKPEWWPTRDCYGRITSEVSDKILFDVGKAVLGKGSGGQITRLLKCLRHDLRSAADLILQADDKSDPRDWFAAVLRKAELDERPLTNHEKYPAEVYR